MTPTEIIGQEAVNKLKDAGFVVVPVEPTQEMLCVAYNATLSRSISAGLGRHLYKAMIKAAKAREL